MVAIQGIDRQLNVFHLASGKGHGPPARFLTRSTDFYLKSPQNQAALQNFYQEVVIQCSQTTTLYHSALVSVHGPV